MRLCVNHINELEMPHLVTNTQQKQSTSILLVAFPMSTYRNKVLWKKGSAQTAERYPAGVSRVSARHVPSDVYQCHYNT